MVNPLRIHRTALDEARPSEVIPGDPYLPQRKCYLHPHPMNPALDLLKAVYLLFRTSRLIASHHSVGKSRCLRMVLSYLGTLERSSHRLADHKRCLNSEACVAYNTDRATYKTRHVAVDCKCLMVSTPYGRLKEIIRQGEIPLISIEDSTDAGATHELRVYPRSRTSRYIATSHVWADGLGNPNENALPLCQIKRLKAHLLALQAVFGDFDGPILFWMDTLCIPVGQDERALRLTQIDKMASIYKGAISSLVLDAELMAAVLGLKLVSIKSFYVKLRRVKVRREGVDTVIRSQRLSIESRARIACSAWMSRSWTLQEGWLPPTIAVQFLDNAVVLGRISEKEGQYQERSTTKGIPLVEDSRALFEANMSARRDVEETEPDNGPSLCGSKQNEHTSSLECDCVGIALERTFYSTFFEETTKFVSVWNELAGRSTTMPSDVPLIITNILHFENRELLKSHEDGEMFQYIILSLDRPPLSIFFNTGPRQDQGGNHQNRWVPVKIGTDTLTSNDPLTVCPSHLLYKYADQHSSGGTSIYTIDAILSLKSKVYLRSENEGIVYAVEPSNSSADQFDTEGFTSTCVIVENVDLPEWSGVKRGACFYVRDNNEIKPQGSRHWWHQALRLNPIVLPGVDMTFYCPRRLQQVVHSEHLTLDKRNIYNLNSVKTTCDFRINYDPLSGFGPLKRRDKNPHALRAEKSFWGFLVLRPLLSYA
ncbi:hypothetical protein MMC22_002169 [Lobaria immixta]|nr:hypothetical protein [Lobaria immixta]